MVRVGVHLRPQVTFRQMVRLARQCESLKFDDVWIDDHVFSYNPIHPIPYLNPWLVLSGIASLTTRLQLGLLVSNVFLQPPSRLLQESLTIHSLSNERFTLGVGAGWFSGDFDALGMKIPNMDYRCGYLNECCQFLTENWLSEDIWWKGNFFEVTMKNYGWKSLLTSRPRLLVGGKHRSLIKIAVCHADELNIELASENEAATLAQIIASSCDAMGRPTSSLSRSVLLTVVLTSNREETRAHRKMFFTSEDYIKEGNIISDNVLIGTADDVITCLGNIVDVLEVDGIIVILFGSESIKNPLMVLKEEISAAL